MTAVTREGATHEYTNADYREKSARPFDGSTDVWPTPAEMSMDIWAAPELPSWTSSPSTRVFEVLPAGNHFKPLKGKKAQQQKGRYKAQKVVVVDDSSDVAATAWAPQDIPCDLADGPSWNGLGASEGEAATAALCWYDNEAEMHLAAKRFVTRFADVLINDFGVAKELPCKFARGLYATKVQPSGKADDVWHHDVCRAEPHVFITALT